MTDSKLPHAISGSIASWSLALVIHWFEKAGTFVSDNGAELARWGALVVTLLTGWAAVETALWRRKQRKKL